MQDQVEWPPEFDSVAADLGWDERRKRYAWRRRMGQSNPEIAKAEGYSIWNAQRLRAIVYADLSMQRPDGSARNAVELANELQRLMRRKRGE